MQEDADTHRRIGEQLLLNLVRLKYRDNPLSLEIGNVLIHFEFRGTAGGEVTLGEGAPTVLSLPGSLTAAEAPTWWPRRGKGTGSLPTGTAARCG